MRRGTLYAHGSKLALCIGFAAAPAAGQELLPVYPTESSDAVPTRQDTQTPRPRFDDHPLAIELRSGSGAATGLAGLVLEYNVHDRLALNAGMGTNLLGLSAAVGARVRPVLGATSNRKQLHALVVEASVSRSAYEGDTLGGILCDDHCLQPRYVGWAQVELGWEARIGRFQLQTSLGAAFLLGSPQFNCRHDGVDSPANCEPSEAPARVLFTQTIGVGYAF